MDISAVSNLGQGGSQVAERGADLSPHASANVTGKQTRMAIEETLAAVNEELAQNMPPETEYRTRLYFDEATARVVAEVVDPHSGAVVDSFPPDLILGFLARNREALGPLVDFSA